MGSELIDQVHMFAILLRNPSMLRMDPDTLKESLLDRLIAQIGGGSQDKVHIFVEGQDEMRVSMRFRARTLFERYLRLPPRS